MVIEEFEVAAFGWAAIKGTRHESRPVDLDEHGPVGDRRWCLVDVERRHVLRTVQHPALLAVRTSGTADELRVDIPGIGTLASRPTPTGHEIEAEYWQRPIGAELMDSPLSAAFSAYLGRPVQLARPRRSAAVYGDTISLLSTASLADLGERAGHPGLVAEAARFRSTYLLHHDTPYVEDTLLGRTIRLGNALVRVGVGIPRCAVVDMNPITGERDARLLTALAAYRPRNTASSPVFAVYASVVDPDVTRRD